MLISQGGPGVFPTGRQVIKGKSSFSGQMGSSTPTAGQSTVAGIFQNPSSTPTRSHIRKALIRPGAVMDVAMGYTVFNYLSSTFSPVNLAFGGNTLNAAPFTGANATPNINTIAIFPSVPVSGFLVEDIGVIIPESVYFVFYGLTVNTALSGTIWWDESIGI